MDQKELRELEHTCIQEEAPWCTAACPLHVDARGFLAQCAKGDWKAARKVLERTMPLPAVLGLICDHPCEAACKRREAGGAIRIGAIERACVQQVSQQSRPLPLPKKDFHVATIGSGFSALTVAYDLTRKGYPITVLTTADAIGGSLLQLDADTLPPAALQAEIDLLQRQGVVFETGQNLDAARLAAIKEEFVACYLDMDAPEAQALLEGDIIPETLETGSKGIFAGGGSAAKGELSPIFEAAQGRKAANSIDRFRQNVSMTAQRDKEGPRETRLYTSLEDVQSQPAVAMANAAGYSEEEATTEAGRCLQCECMECVKNCLYLQHYKGYPKKYAREIYNNEAIVKGLHKANKLINSCMLCGQCTVLCPNDFPMAALCRGVRQSKVRIGNMPPSAHDFALEDLRFNMSNRFYLARPALPEDGATKTKALFFPGCHLAGSRPEHVERVWAWMREHCTDADGGIGLFLGCCGAPADWAGREDLFQQILDALRSSWEELGQPQLVTACSTCCTTFGNAAPEFQAVTLWEYMDGKPLPEGAAALQDALPLHDPCTSRELPETQNAVRRMLATLSQKVEELKTGREVTECCGYGGLLSTVNPSLGRDVATRRGQQAEGDFLAYCAMCRDALAQGGKRTLHLLDLLFPLEEADPAGRAAPGFSDRHDKREALRRKLVQQYWKEEPRALEAHESISLDISAAVQALLDERRILREDVQRVIHHAETSGKKLTDPDTGHFLAYHRPVRVTFWVEYAPTDAGFIVYNAYSHRMVLPVKPGEKDEGDGR